MFSKQFARALCLCNATLLAAALTTSTALAGEFDIVNKSFSNPPFSNFLPSFDPAVSADGRTIVYETYARIAPRGHSLYMDVVVSTVDSTGAESSVTISAGADGHSAAADVSGDGRYVAFYSQASNLSPDDANGNLTNVFVYDRDTNSYEVITPDQDSDDLETGRYRRPEGRLRISGNGRFVAFFSQASNLTNLPNPSNTRHLYLWDRDEQTLVRVTNEADADSDSVDISDDGTWLVFSSQATNLLDTEQAPGRRLYLYNTDSGVLSLIPSTESGNESVISGDGRFIAFNSTEDGRVGSIFDQLITDIYLLDRTTGEKILVTAGADQRSEEPALSGDGNKLTFITRATNLLPGDDNGAWDVYVYTRDSGALTHLTPVSDGINLTPAIDASGNTIVFASAATNLLDEPDTNAVIDIYSWREEPLEPADCEPLPAGVLRSSSGVSVRVRGRDSCLPGALVSFGATDSNGVVVPANLASGGELNLQPNNRGQVPADELVFYTYPQLDGTTVYATDFPTLNGRAVTMSFAARSLSEFEVFEFAVFANDPLNRDNLLYAEHGTTWTFTPEFVSPDVAVTGRIFHDLNGNGLMELNETAVPAFTSLRLFYCGDRDGQAAGDSIRPGDSGEFNFNGLDADEYQLGVGPTRGWTVSQGGFDDNGNPVSPIRAVLDEPGGFKVGFTDCTRFDGVNDPVWNVGVRME